MPSASSTHNVLKLIMVKPCLVLWRFITVLRQLVPPLRSKTYGWIKDNYLNAIVELETIKSEDQSEDNHNTSMNLDLPQWLFDEIGLPNWSSFLTTDQSLSCDFASLPPSSQPLGP